MPIGAGMGGNAGTRTLTVFVRGLALGEMEWSNGWRPVWKEVVVGFANGAAKGLITTLIVGLRTHDWVLATIPRSDDLQSRHRRDRRRARPACLGSAGRRSGHRFINLCHNLHGCRRFFLIPGPWPPWRCAGSATSNEAGREGCLWKVSGGFVKPFLALSYDCWLFNQASMFSYT